MSRGDPKEAEEIGDLGCYYMSITECLALNGDLLKHLGTDEFICES